MSGPGQPGRPKKGGEEEVEYQLFKAELVSLRRQNLSYTEIASQMGMNVETIRRTMKKVWREKLDEAGAEEVRAREMERLYRIVSRYEPALFPVETEEGKLPIPNIKVVDSYLRVVNMMANLTGAYAPKSLDLTVKQLDDDETHHAAERVASLVERFTSLADRLMYGSGVITNEQTVEDIVDAELVETIEEATEPMGEWVDGKFRPNLAIAPAPPPEEPK